MDKQSPNSESRSKEPERTDQPPAKAAGTPNSQTPLVQNNKTITAGESFWKAAGRFQPMR